MTELPDDYREMLEKIVEDIDGEMNYLTTLKIAIKNCIVSLVEVNLAVVLI